MKAFFAELQNQKNIKVTKEEFLKCLADKGVITRLKQGMIEALAQSEEEIREILPPNEAEEYISFRRSVIKDTEETWFGYDEDLSIPNAAEEPEVYE